MKRSVLRLCLVAAALAAASAVTVPSDTEAQARWSYAATAQYQIRQYPPSGVCPPGFGPQSFNYAGWGVRPLYQASQAETVCV